MEKRGAVADFKIADVAADGGLRGIQFLGSTGKTLQARDSLKRAQRIQGGEGGLS